MADNVNVKKSKSKNKSRSNPKSKLKSNSQNKMKDITAPRSKSELARLVFPVARIIKYMKKGGYSSRVPVTSAVCLAGILEYLTAEVLELSGQVVKDHNQLRIRPRHIQLAIKSDDELTLLLQHVTIRDGGVVPSIHDVLRPRYYHKDKKKGSKGKGKSKSKSKSTSRSKSQSQYNSQEF